MKSMNEITIPQTTITPEQYGINARQLVAAVLLQAARDYCKDDSERKRSEIIKSLRSPYMDFMSNGMSIVVADQLKLHPDEISERLKYQQEEEL